MSDFSVYPGPQLEGSPRVGWHCPKCKNTGHDIVYKTRRPKNRPDLDAFVERRISSPGTINYPESHQEAWDQMIEEWENTPEEWLQVKCNNCGFSRKELPADVRN